MEDEDLQDTEQPTFSCCELNSIDELRDALHEHSTDFWLGCLPGDQSLADHISGMQVANMWAAEAFTHCLFISSENAELDVTALTEDFGMGLRKKRVKSRPGPGTVFVLVSLGGFSKLYRERFQSAEKMSNAGRLNINIVDIKKLQSAADDADDRFWLVAFGNIEVEDCKDKVLQYRLEGEHRFRNCLLAETDCCKLAAEELRQKYGHGLRATPCRGPQGRGILALFLNPAKSEASKNKASKGLLCHNEEDAREFLTMQADQGIQDDGMTLKALAKRQRRTENASRPLQALSPTATSRTLLREAAASTVTATLSIRKAKVEKPDEEAETQMSPAALELYRRQVNVLKKRVEQLLPTLPRSELSTSRLLAKLEETMQKPKGRFDKFRDEIEQVLLAFVASHSQAEATVLPADAPATGSTHSPAAASVVSHPPSKEAVATGSDSAPLRTALHSLSAHASELQPAAETAQDTGATEGHTQLIAGISKPSTSEVVPEQAAKPSTSTSSEGSAARTETIEVVAEGSDAVVCDSASDGETLDEPAEVDEYGFQVALSQLREAGGLRPEDAAAVLRTLRASKPTDELLRFGAWEAALTAYQHTSSSSLISRLAHQVSERWRLLRDQLQGNKVSQQGLQSQKKLPLVRDQTFYDKAFAAMAQLQALSAIAAKKRPASPLDRGHASKRLPRPIVIDND